MKIYLVSLLKQLFLTKILASHEYQFKTYIFFFNQNFQANFFHLKKKFLFSTKNTSV